ncbi:DUF2065 family protein [Roseateles cellulosilyticus]|uniref:DUF2065 domain-containing protein n=1 Tax=Pelomonas cellulosilytica TaxID=2906762 RepID=A0ABS8XRW2_9BURK|nr:DUF2065 domain-containing protein [Pelomonas sp. P8]
MKDLLTALALMLIIEGLLPFASPSRWREVFSRIVAMGDGQIRFIGLASVMLGLLGLLFLH